MKLPKKFNKMTKDEQETYLVERLLILIGEEDRIRKMLAQVRGGQKLEVVLDERPDELGMKETA